MRVDRHAFGFLLPAVLIVMPLAGIFGPKGENPDEKRATIKKESTEILQDLYKEKPELRQEIAKAPGYATFSNMNMNLFLLASGNGYGMVVDNRTGKETFMRMASLGAGVGMGAKDFRVVFAFNDAEAMETFIKTGWQFEGKADAMAQSGDKGAGVGETGAVDTGGKGGVSAGAAEMAGVEGPMEIYQLTDAGLALQAVVAGTKYWQDGKLNP